MAQSGARHPFISARHFSPFWPPGRLGVTLDGPSTMKSFGPGAAYEKLCFVRFACLRRMPPLGDTRIYRSRVPRAHMVRFHPQTNPKDSARPERITYSFPHANVAPILLSVITNRPKPDERPRASGPTFEPESCHFEHLIHNQIH